MIGCECYFTWTEVSYISARKSSLGSFCINNSVLISKNFKVYSDIRKCTFRSKETLLFESTERIYLRSRTTLRFDFLHSFMVCAQTSAF